MGGSMSCLTGSSSQPKPASPKPSSNNKNASSPSSSFIKSKSLSKRASTPYHHHSQRRRMHTKEKQNYKKNLMEMSSRDYSLTLDDHSYSPSSAGFRTPRRKIHPSSSTQGHRRLIRDAKDSMCLERPVMMGKYKIQHEVEEEERSECLSSICKEEKRVRFKLPHKLIWYSPEVEEGGGHSGYYCNVTTSDDDYSSSSFYFTLEENLRGGGGSSFESHSPDEICVKLAVNTLPQASFSSML